MPTNVIYGNSHVAGHFSCQSMTIPALTITDSMISASAAISADKLVHRHVVTHMQKNGTAVIAETVPIYICTAVNGAVVQSISVVITGAVGTDDRVVTIDLKKTGEGDTPATILTATFNADATTTLYEVLTGTLDDGTLVETESLLLYITVSGASGTQAQGIIVQVAIDEQPV